MTRFTDRLAAIPGFQLEDIETDQIHPTREDRDRYTFLARAPILRDVDEDVRWQLARAGCDERWADGDVIVRQGDRVTDGRFYIVREGAVDVVVTDSDGREDVVACLTDGDYFGELALLADQPRNATIRAAGDATVVSFDATTFLGVIAQHVLIFRMVRAQRSSKGALRVRELGLFSDMPLHDLTRVLHDAEQRFCPAGTRIVTEGDEGDRFYVILDGLVVVERSGQQVAELATGDFFGETALLFGCRRTASVVAERPTMVWSLGRESFQAVVRHYLLGNRRMRDTVANRLRSTA